MGTVAQNCFPPVYLRISIFVWTLIPRARLGNLEGNQRVPLGASGARLKLLLPEHDVKKGATKTFAKLGHYGCKPRRPPNGEGGRRLCVGRYT